MQAEKIFFNLDQFHTINFPKMKRSLLLCLVAMFLCRPGLSQWESIGPYGGHVANILHTNDYIIAYGFYGMYKSEDNGTTWSVINLPEDPGYIAATFNEGKLYIALPYKGVYISPNYGETWEEKTTDINQVYTKNIYVSGDEIYITGLNDGIFVSTDNGNSWNEKISGIEGIKFNDIIEFNSEIYIGGDGFYKTTDQGETWTEVSDPGFSDEIKTMTIHNNHFYVGLSNSVYISTNGADFNFSPATVTSPRNFATTGDSVFIVAYGSIYYTKDDGASWSEIPNHATTESLNSAFINENVFLVASDDGIHKLEESGDTWTFSHKGYTGLNITTFFHRDGYLFAGSLDNGLYRTDEDGENWKEINNGLASQTAKSIYSSVLVGDSLFVGTSDGMYLSVNNGDSWEKVPQIPDLVNDIDFDGANIVATVRNEGIYYSPDFGISWTLLNNEGLTVNEGLLVTIELDGNNIFTSNYISQEIFLTSDFGETWTVINQNQNFYANDLLWQDEILYAATSSGIKTTDDQGETWSTLKNDNTSFENILYQNDIFYVNGSSGVFFSSKEDDSWNLSEGARAPFNGFYIYDNYLYTGTTTISAQRRSLLELNYPPTILGSVQNLEVDEGQTLELSIDDLEIVDLNHPNTNGFSLVLSEGDNYSYEGNTIIPDDGFFGQLTIPIQVNDGIDNSEVFNLLVTVNEVVLGLAKNDSNFLVYPNPVSNQISIESISLNEQNLQVQLIDLDGKVNLQKTINNRTIKQEIDLNDLSNGLYVLKIINNGKTVFSKKIIK